MSSHPYNETLQCTLDRFDNGRAILRLSDGQELLVPRRYLPRNVGEGQTLLLHLHTEEMATRQKEELARAILKEILSG